MQLEQLEFPEMKKAIAATTRNKLKSSRRFAGMTEENFMVALMRSLAAENLSFTTYALMLSVHRKPSPPAVVRLVIETGFSY